LAVENKITAVRPYELQHPNSALVRISRENETQLVLHVPGGKLQAVADASGALTEGFVRRPSDLDKLLRYFEDIQVTQNIRVKAAPAALCGASPMGELRARWIGPQLYEWIRREPEGVMACAKALENISGRIIGEVRRLSGLSQEEGAYSCMVLEENGWREESPLILPYCVPFYQRLQNQTDRFYLLCRQEIEPFMRQMYGRPPLLEGKEENAAGIRTFFWA
jgi:hypothetical protein